MGINGGEQFIHKPVFDKACFLGMNQIPDDGIHEGIVIEAKDDGRCSRTSSSSTGGLAEHLG